MLMFAHGFNIHFGNNHVPPADVDVTMIVLRVLVTQYVQNILKVKGVPCLIAAEQDATGKAQDLALYALGIGGARAGVLETTFRTETKQTYLGEQAVLCGGVTALCKQVLKHLLKQGYDPRNAYFECIHEMKLIVDLIFTKAVSRV